MELLFWSLERAQRQEKAQGEEGGSEPGALWNLYKQASCSLAFSLYFFRHLPCAKRLSGRDCFLIKLRCTDPEPSLRNIPRKCSLNRRLCPFWSPVPTCVSDPACLSKNTFPASRNPEIENQPIYSCMFYILFIYFFLYPECLIHLLGAQFIALGQS